MLLGQTDTLIAQWYALSRAKEINDTAAATAAWWMLFNTGLQASLISAMLVCGLTVIIAAARKVWTVTQGFQRSSFAAAVAAE